MLRFRSMEQRSCSRGERLRATHGRSGSYLWVEGNRAGLGCVSIVFVLFISPTIEWYTPTRWMADSRLKLLQPAGESLCYSLMCPEMLCPPMFSATGAFC